MQRRRTHTVQPAAPRRGLVLLVVMVCLLIMTVAGGSALKMALSQRRQLQREQFRRQAGCLADSAIGRAAAQLTADPDYANETWNVTAESLDTGHAAAVEIRVEQSQQQPSRRVVSVVVDYPSGMERRARVSRAVSIDMPEAE